MAKSPILRYTQHMSVMSHQYPTYIPPPIELHVAMDGHRIVAHPHQAILQAQGDDSLSVYSDHLRMSIYTWIHEFTHVYLLIYVYDACILYIYNYMYIYLASFSFMCVYIYMYFSYSIWHDCTHILSYINLESLAPNLCAKTVSLPSDPPTMPLCASLQRRSGSSRWGCYSTPVILVILQLGKLSWLLSEWL